MTLKKIIVISVLTTAVLDLAQLAQTSTAKPDIFAPTWASASPVQAAPPAKFAKMLPSDEPTTAEPSTAGQAGSPQDAANAAQRLQRAGLKPQFAQVYIQAQSRTGTPWQLLAAVHTVETGQSDSTSRASSAGAVGPMQFLPSTFAHYATDGDGDGKAQITNASDAIFTAGRYLAADGANHGQYATALYGYNHSWSYVSKVLGIAHGLGL